MQGAGDSKYCQNYLSKVILIKEFPLNGASMENLRCKSSCNVRCRHTRCRDCDQKIL
jgi:hypothetical protein